MQSIAFIIHVLGFILLSYLIDFVIKPRLWKRYQRTEFLRQKNKPQTKVAPKWQYNIFVALGIIVFMTILLVICLFVPSGIFYLRYIYRGIPLTQGVEGIDILLYFISSPFGVVSGIFLINTLSYFYFPSFIKRDLLNNMRRARQSVEPEVTELESENQILKKYDINKIQNHDWVLMLRIWSVLAILMLGTSLLFIFVL